MISSSFLTWYWNERFWLPRNVTWADLRNTEEEIFPQAVDLWFAFPYAIILYGIRILIERLVCFIFLCNYLCQLFYKSKYILVFVKVNY